MNRATILEKIKINFEKDIIEFFDKSPTRVYLEVKPEAITKVTQFIFRDLEARFNIASGVDTRHDMEIIYHFTIERINLLISVRIKLPKDKKIAIASIAHIIKGANWIEREMNELLGIEFKGHPNLKRLLLSEDWPKKVYPLRQDYKEWDKKAIRDRGV